MILSTYVDRQAKKHLKKTLIQHQVVYDHVLKRADWTEFVRRCTLRCNEIEVHYPYLFNSRFRVKEFIGRCVIKWAVVYMDKLNDEYQEGTPEKPELLTI